MCTTSGKDDWFALPAKICLLYHTCNENLSKSNSHRFPVIREIVYY